MRFRHVLEYDSPPDEVFAMLADPEFREKVCHAQDAHGCEVRISPAGEAMNVVVDQRRPSEGIPGFARKIVGDEIRILQNEEWSGSRTASLHVSIPGKPGDLKGTVTLAGDGAGTVETVEGDLVVSIPLLGGKLEALIADLLGSALRAEESVGRAWLSGAR